MCPVKKQTGKHFAWLNYTTRQLKGISMIKHWHRLKHYYLTHDGIEMALFAAVLGSFAWMAYHVIVGIIGRFG